jgi:O-antigen/teichoic acid export membrane protein
VAGLPIISPRVSTTSGRPSLGDQTARLAIGRGGAALCSAIWFIVAARELTLDAFGSLALLLSLGLMFSIVTDLGLSSVLADEVAVRPAVARAATRTVIATRLRLSLVSAVLTGGAYAVAGGHDPVAVSVLFAISIFATAVYSSFNAVFRAQHAAGIEGLNEVASRALLLLGGGAALRAGAGLVGAVGAYALVDVASMVVLAFVFRRRTRDAAAPVSSDRLSLRRAAPLGGAGVVGTVYSRLDTWLVALIKGDAAVARYGAAYRCFDALLLPATAVASLSIPHTAGLELRELRGRLSRLALLATALTVPIALLALVFASPVLTTLFGDDFAAAAPALRVLAVAAVPSAVVLSLLPPIALRSARAVIALGVALVANLTANLIVIPAYGGLGAAWTTLGCQVALAAWLIIETRRLGAVR